MILKRITKGDKVIVYYKGTKRRKFKFLLHNNGCFNCPLELDLTSTESRCFKYNIGGSLKTLYKLCYTIGSSCTFTK